MAVDTEWLSKLKNMNFDDLATQYAPLIAKYSRWNIPGLDSDDIAQEVRTVLWKCQQQFDPETKTGFNGRPSSFTNYLIRSIENWLGKQPRRFSESYYRPTTGYECIACGEPAPINKGKACSACGKGRFRAVRGGSLMSYDMPDESGSPFIDPEDPFVFEDSILGGLALRNAISRCPPDVQRDISMFLAGEPILETRTRRVRRKGEKPTTRTVTVDVTNQRMARIRSL